MLDVGGLVASETYDFSLEGAGPSVNLGSATADRTGSLILEATLPPLIAGTYAIEVSDGRITVLQQPIQIVAGPQLSLSEAQGSPGDLIDFTAVGLLPGVAELRMDDTRLAGPLPIRGEFSGTFEVPANAGPMATVRVIQRVGRLVTGVAEHPFTVLDGDGRRTIPEVRSVNLPTSPLRPEQTQSVVGEVSLPSHVLADPQTEYSLFLEVCGDGSVVPAPKSAIPAGNAKGENCVRVPADGGSVVVGPDGEFAADVSLPSLLFGGAVPPSPTGTTNDLGLVYAHPETSGSVSLGLTSGAPLPSDTFTIRVTDLFDNPLEGALVGVLNGYLVDPECNLPECPQQAAPIGPTIQAENQVNWWLEQQLEFELDGLNTCPTSLYRQFTNAGGQVTFTITPDQLANGLKWSQLIANNSPDINTHIRSFPRYLGFTIQINALATESGTYGVVNSSGAATGIWYDLFFDVETSRFYEGSPGNDILNGGDPEQLGYEVLNDRTLTFRLGPVSGTQFQFPTDPWIPGLASYILPRRTDDTDLPPRTVHPGTPLFRSLIHTGQPAGVDLLRTKEAEVRFKHDEFVFGVLDSLTLEIDGLAFNNPVQYSMELTSPTAGNCEPGGVEYRAIIPQANLLPPGGYRGILYGQVGNDGPAYTREFRFVVEEMPQWIIGSPNLTDQKVLWAPGDVRLSAFEVPEMAAISLNPSPNYDVGTLGNDSQNDGAVFQRLGNDGFGDIERLGTSDNIALNRETGPEMDPVAVNGDGSTPQLIGEKGFEETILESGKIPLFRYGWGFWPIAQATVGADFWFNVLFETYGVIELGDEMNTRVAAIPSVEAGIDLFIDASILFDVVTVNVMAIPSIAMRMIAVMGTDTDMSCERFEFDLRAKFEVSVGFCPLCIESAGTVPLINAVDGEGCEPPDFDTSQTVANDLTKGAPISDRPVGRAAVATNGRGQSLRAYTEADGSVVVESTSAGVLMNTVVFAAKDLRGLTSMDVTWLSRDRGVMVWSQSALSETDFSSLRTSLAINPEEEPDAMGWQGVIASQHLRYAVYENGQWSSPMMLTAPGLGEGGVQLASCPGEELRTSACPPQGEVLLVWSRDLDNTLTGNQRVFFSTFDGMAWTPPERLDDSSDAKEVQPSATYIDGVPVAVWVRNPTRMLADVGQRELVYRFLDSNGVSPVPAEISKGVASPSIGGDGLGRVVVAYTVARDPGAFLGNRRNLHIATGDCSIRPCSWVQTELLDAFDRRIWAERPQLTVTPGDVAIIAFRHLGYGSLVNEPVVRAGDSLGATLGSGDLAMITLQLDTGLLNFDPLTDDGQIHFGPDLAYDPFVGTIETTSIAFEPAGVVRAKSRPRPPVPTRGLQTRLGSGAGPTHIRVSRQPDLAISRLEAVPAPAGLPNVSIEVDIENRGGPFADPFWVALTWDGPGGSGFAAHYEQLNDPGPGGTTLAIDAAFPEGATADERHTLYAVVDVYADTADSNGVNNQRTVTVGGIRGPRIEGAQTSRYAAGVHLDWEDAG